MNLIAVDTTHFV